MFAELPQIEDPDDLGDILRDLPERERAEFLRQYHGAVDVDHDAVSRQQMRQLLHAWRLTAIAASRDGYYEELAAVQNGTAQSRPAEEVIPDWQEWLAAARAQMR